MATQDNSSGLLSKVAKFVRNPTTDWADLDKLELPPQESHSKEALKKMIERKRFDDAERKSEFDQLRKLRRASPATTPVPSGLSSLSPDTSGYSESGERAITLKKIDEIEAQMSKQWWKGQQPTVASKLSDTPKPVVPTAKPTPKHLGVTACVDTLNSFATTISFDLHAPSDNVPTQNGAGVGSDFRPGMPGGRSMMPESGLPPSGAPTLDAGQNLSDPTLEEAAIRFANGDDAGADAVLQAALLDQNANPALLDAWAGALFDLYRSIGQQSSFEQFALDYTRRFGRIAPAWYCIPERLAAYLASNGLSTQLQTVGAAPAVWTCPTELNVQTVVKLSTFALPDQLLKRLDWHQLQAITPQAGQALAELFSRWCEQPLILCFDGAEALELCLRAATPVNDREVSTYWWQLRLDLCRVMRWQDEFDMAALDFCITYEVSPPAWQVPHCRLVGHAEASMPPALGGVRQLELVGEVLGDTGTALVPLQDALQESGLLVVSCSHLIRVDFSAAGSLLNWVAKVQSSGGQIELRDVSRLVAAFFNLVGINEYVQVNARTN